jgi:hypothetical protein
MSHRGEKILRDAIGQSEFHADIMRLEGEAVEKWLDKVENVGDKNLVEDVKTIKELLQAVRDGATTVFLTIGRLKDKIPA